MFRCIGALDELQAWLLRCPQPVHNALGISTERRTASVPIVGPQQSSIQGSNRLLAYDTSTTNILFTRS